MSQVDRLVYIPLLFWFIILFVGLYLIIYCYFLPMFYTVFKTRRLFFFNLFQANELAVNLFYFCFFSYGFFVTYRYFSYFGLIYN